MASPQKEDGYTPIANEILDALCMKSVLLSDYEWTCLMFIFRKTYGWGKPEDRISLSQFVSGTHIQRSHVCRSLKKLLKKRIITQSGNGYHVTYSFQKNYELWKSLPKQVILPNQVMVKTVTQTGNELVPNQVMGVVPNQAHTKETITKEKKERFSPPLIADCITYFTEQNSTKDEGEKFFYHFTSNGWKVGGKAHMKNWHASAQGWIRRNNNFGGKNGVSTQNKKHNKLSASDAIAQQSRAL